MTEEILMRLKEQIQGLEKRVSVLEDATPLRREILQEQVQSKSLSLREFVAEKNPENDVQRTLIIGYFLEHHKKMDSFNIEDIEREFRSAKMVPPTNINDKINMNIRKGGLIMEAQEKKDAKKAWTLTDSGEKEVEKGFNSKQL